MPVEHIRPILRRRRLPVQFQRRPIGRRCHLHLPALGLQLAEQAQCSAKITLVDGIHGRKRQHPPVDRRLRLTRQETALAHPRPPALPAGCGPLLDARRHIHRLQGPHPAQIGRQRRRRQHGRRQQHHQRRRQQRQPSDFAGRRRSERVFSQAASVTHCSAPCQPAADNVIPCPSRQATSRIVLTPPLA